jgi:hypothetical protein
LRKRPFPCIYSVALQKDALSFQMHDYYNSTPSQCKDLFGLKRVFKGSTPERALRFANAHFAIGSIGIILGLD